MKKTFQNKNHKILPLTLAFLLFTLNFLLVSCNTTEPRDGYALTLAEEDVSCTEAWLKAKAKNFNLPVKVNLYLNNSLKKTITLTTQDTVIYDDGLLPDRTYKYRAEIALSQETVIKSQTIILTTMDTTSNDFTWQTYTFGEVNGSSVLYDVAIINENDIWAVGEIHTEDDFDSLGHYHPYNAVHWDGQEWELKRIGSGYGNPYYTVYAFNENDVWFDGTIQWDGSRYSAHTNNFPLEPNGDGWRVNAMWGTSSSDFYVVGNNGNIAHYDGSSWEKIESGTEVDIQDIYGIKVNGEEIVACTVTNIATSGNGKILLFRNSYKQTIFWPSGLRINSIWYKTERQMFACGDGIYKRIGINWERQIQFENTTYTEKIRGNDINDLFVGGDFGFLAHYNGVSWKVYKTGNVALFYSLSVKGDLVVGVGERNAKGVVYIGRRN